MEKLERLKVLVVDDENFMQTLITQQLNMLGVKIVYNCQGAAEALQLLSSQPEELDLIIFDLRMPDIDGIEFLRQLIAINYQGWDCTGERGGYPRIAVCGELCQGQQAVHTGSSTQAP